MKLFKHRLTRVFEMEIVAENFEQAIKILSKQQDISPEQIDSVSELTFVMNLDLSEESNTHKGVKLNNEQVTETSQNPEG